VIRALVDPLAEAGINVHDLITSATSVAIFVAWEDREETLDIVHDQF
jgi:aspartate kinase